MKYRLVFVGGKGRKKLDSLTGSLEAGWFSDVPLPLSLTISQIGFGGRERKTMGWLAELLLPLQYRLFWQRRRRRGGRQERGEGGEGGCIDQPEEWRGRGGEGERQAGKGSRPDQYTTAAWGQGGASSTENHQTLSTALSNP